MAGSPETATCGAHVIESISPSVRGNTGDTTITMSGSNFQTGATCSLVQGNITIQSILSTPSPDGTELSCTFALNGAATGGYTVTATNPGGTTFTRPIAFTVRNGGQPQVWANIVSRSVRTGTPETMVLQFGIAETWTHTSRN